MCSIGAAGRGARPGELLVKEKVHARTSKEEEEFAKKSPQEKREQEEAEALGRQGPHAQQPNQLGGAFDLDGDHDEGLADLVINQIAVEGFTPNTRISIGVMSAPPPAPVMPTRNPTIALPRMMYGSTCTIASVTYRIQNVNYPTRT